MVLPFFSVIIPVYNRTSVLKRAVESVIAQTFRDYEIIIVNDGSTDKTDEVINSLKSSYKQISAIHLDNNHGVSYARNRGIEKSAGTFISILDSDDEWHKNKLEKQASFIKENRDCLICHTDEIWIRNGVRVNPKKKHKKPDKDIFFDCLPLCPVSPSSTVIKKDIFYKEGFFDEDLPACEDYDLWLRLSAKYKFSLIDEPLLTKYGGHEDQLSAKYWGMDRFRIIALLKILNLTDLPNDKIEAVSEMLIKKARILSAGFLKRNKLFQSNLYNELSIIFSKKLMKEIP
ncbi:MAG: glycosyltransferase family 2 protein [Spirochaetes bacterium]|nr:glycosyltransferase family 2 protein [Spirochaetota bacterium]